MAGHVKSASRVPGQPRSARGPPLRDPQPQHLHDRASQRHFGGTGHLGGTGHRRKNQDRGSAMLAWHWSAVCSCWTVGFSCWTVGFGGYDIEGLRKPGLVAVSGSSPRNLAVAAGSLRPASGRARHYGACSGCRKQLSAGCRQLDYKDYECGKSERISQQQRAPSRNSGPSRHLFPAGNCTERLLRWR